ncbi:MAG: hypothetical protein D8M58_01005 [Calditrichaeota bacterium]|nr:MAG: hypothetical protein DWQ03_06075 [Calditrichota bacterium]MBL1203946.1 hypothetical protein [Calditrichota bacterium]
MTLNVLIVVIIFSIISFAQSDKQITKIKENYYALKELQPDLEKKSIIEMGYSTGGAEFTFFINDFNQVLIVEAEFLGEIGKSNHEYYYKNDSLFFLLIIDEYYNSPVSSLSMTDEELKEDGMEMLDYSKSSVSENRYYFAKGQLIKWLDNNNKSVQDTTREFKKLSKDHFGFSKELLSKYQHKEND